MRGSSWILQWVQRTQRVGVIRPKTGKLNESPQTTWEVHNPRTWAARCKTAERGGSPVGLGLRTWPCHCSGLDCCYDPGSIPDPGIFTCCGRSQKEKKKKRKSFARINSFCQTFGSPKVLHHQKRALGTGGSKGDHIWCDRQGQKREGRGISTETLLVTHRHQTFLKWKIKLNVILLPPALEFPSRSFLAQEQNLF